MKGTLQAEGKQAYVLKRMKNVDKGKCVSLYEQ